MIYYICNYEKSCKQFWLFCLKHTPSALIYLFIVNFDTFFAKKFVGAVSYFGKYLCFSEVTYTGGSRILTSCCRHLFVKNSQLYRKSFGQEVPVTETFVISYRLFA